MAVALLQLHLAERGHLWHDAMPVAHDAYGRPSDEHRAQLLLKLACSTRSWMAMQHPHWLCCTWPQTSRAEGCTASEDC